MPVIKRLLLHYIPTFQLRVNRLLSSPSAAQSNSFGKSLSPRVTVAGSKPVKPGKGMSFKTIVNAFSYKDCNQETLLEALKHATLIN